MRTLPARLAGLCLLCVASTALGVGPVHNVNSFADVPDAAIDGVCNTTLDNAHPTCTLRAAVMEADGYGGVEEVTINLQAGTYALTRAIGMPDDASNGDLNLTKKVRIVGKGLDLSIIDANHLDRAILVDGGAVATLSDLRVQGGRPPVSATRTGYDYGGGICCYGGSLTLLRCLVRDNQVPGTVGGGVAALYGGLTVIDSMIRVNGCGASGFGSGGGVYTGSTATVISGSAIYSNNAPNGAGVHVEAGTLKITNSTISANAAASQGGGLSLFAVSNAALNNVTIATNAAATGGGGIALDTASIQISNSILFNTSGQTFDDIHCTSSTVASNGSNIIHAANACVSGVYGTADPSILAIANNGGLTATHALSSSSPAANAGSPSGCTDTFGAPLLVDQRGVKRPIGAQCDLGAFEREPVGDANGDGAVNVSDVFYLINYLFAAGPVPLGRASVNGDAPINVSDVFYLLNYLFAGGAAPV